MIGLAAALVILTWIPWSRIGSEFMPPLDEGTILFMPTGTGGRHISAIQHSLSSDGQLILNPE